MAPLTANREVDRYVDQELRSFQVAASTTIYKGSLVSVQADGYVAPLTAGELFAGIAYEAIDNSAGSDGDLSVRVYTLGDFEHALAGAAIANIGDPVFATDDGTLSLTATGNSRVGTVIDVPSSGNIILRLKAQGYPAAHITDPTGGGTVDAESRTAIDSILVVLENAGLTKSA